MEGPQPDGEIGIVVEPRREQPHGIRSTPPCPGITGGGPHLWIGIGDRAGADRRGGGCAEWRRRLHDPRPDERIMLGEELVGEPLGELGLSRR